MSTPEGSNLPTSVKVHVPRVRWMDSDTLEMALSWVPDLEVAIDRALMQGMSLEIHVKVSG